MNFRRPSRRLPILAAIAALALLALPALASAAPSALNVIGTSDVSDSGLMPNLVIPGFNAAYPQYLATYNGFASGAAIQNAEQGNGAPSVLIVHAASLENQFVAAGYSYANQYGYALFTNDFVLTGPTSDPAGIATAAPHDIARAFADLAAAGVAGTATFESRGGNANAPGTTVEEHKLWQLVAASGLTPSGVYLCQVSAADGGGLQPVASATAANLACPDNGTATGADLPGWYKVNTGNQAANVEATNACNNPTTSPVGTSCYALTDRGTYDYLESEATSANPDGLASKLEIVTRQNGATAPGGANALVNYFHAYVVNPSKPDESVNLPAAQAFIAYLTSPAVQAQIGSYLSATRDPGGAPFVPDASPGLTAAGLPSSLTAGQSATVSGQVTNREPGFAVLAGQTVTVDELAGTVPIPVASGTTSATGAYSVSFIPPSSGSYEVSTGDISLIENASLNPVYGDILSPAATAASALAVDGVATISEFTTSPGAVELSGPLLPAVPTSGASVELLARPQSSTDAFKVVGTETPAVGASAYAVDGKLKGGSWTVRAQYADPGSLGTALTGTRTVIVPFREVSTRIAKLRLAGARLTLTGRLDQAPADSGATVRLYALSVGTASAPRTAAQRQAAARAAVAHRKRRLRPVATVRVRRGRVTYTITHTFAAGHRYVLQLRYENQGQRTSYSRYRYVTVR